MSAPPAPSDPELLRRAQDGDTGAFAELVDRHRRAVHRAALVACGSPADADDVAQDAFVAAHRALGAYRGDAAVRTWLLSIAWRKGLDRRRSLRRWLRFGTDTGETEEWLEARPSPDQPIDVSLAARELARDVRRLMRSLPRPLRDALLLAGNGEHTYQEIAAMLGVPLGTVKWRVSEARRLLRTKLQALGHRP